MTFERIIKACIAVANKPHCHESKDWKKDALQQIENLGFASEYAEPGYSDPKKGILFGNWNYFPNVIERPNRDKAYFTSILERAGYELEWEDEWSTCQECNRAVRMSPDSYGWTANFVIMNECELLCIDCIAKDAATYLESIENDPKVCCNSHIDPTEHGYKLVQDRFENGFHPGQNDDPKKIYKQYQDETESKRLIFKLDATGQFDINFSLYEKIQDSEEQQ